MAELVDSMTDIMQSRGLIARDADARALLSAFAFWVDGYQWILPMVGEPAIDEATDDAACAVCRQMALELEQASKGRDE